MINMPMPAKSARLKLLHGNTGKQNTNELKKRAKNEERMKMPTDKLRSPPWLDKEGREAFLFVVKELTEIDVAGNADLHTIALYADFYSQYLKYRRLVKAKGNWVGGRPNPFIAKMDSAAKQMRAYSADLGLSPVARSRLAIKLAEEDETEWT
ncbi:phage terminase small subunit P27 family [Listeria monocytogenes]|nr:phage terminase [Listeria monocytogenes FSL J2-071]RFQ28273.1 phage terminase small subunit P27 family [Listeria monocytogenes]